MCKQDVRKLRGLQMFAAAVSILTPFDGSKVNANVCWGIWDYIIFYLRRRRRWRPTYANTELDIPARF